MLSDRDWANEANEKDRINPDSDGHLTSRNMSSPKERMLVSAS